MVSSPSWRDHFKIDDSILEAFWEDFSQSSPIRASEMNPARAEQSIEFVLWCVQQGHFTEEAYTKWQSQAFEIPVIRRTFFDVPADLVFWERVKELHPWSATCVPLAEWDDVLLVAITNPEIHLELSKRHRLVLATPTSLREYFERVDQDSVSNPVFKVPDMRPTEAAIPPANARPAEIVAPAEVVTPPEVILPPVVEAKKPVIESKPPVKVDDGDPFAALSRELGLLNQSSTEGSDDQHGNGLAAHDDNSIESAAPAGLVIPEGLSFDPAELARLNGLDLAPAENQEPSVENNSDSPDLIGPGDQSEVNFGVNTSDGNLASASSAPAQQVSSNDEDSREGGTFVHNFETGANEFVQSPIENSELPAAPKAPVPPVQPLALDLPQVEDDPLAALVMPQEPVAPEAPKPGRNSEIPGLPFSIPRNSDASEDLPPILADTISHASPFEGKTFGQKPALAPDDLSIPGLEELDKTHPSAVVPNPDPIKVKENPPLVQQTSDASAPLAIDPPPSTARVRKPLFEPVSTTPPKTTGNAFEPRSSSGPGFDATKAVSIQNNGAAALEQTQSGTSTGTQTKSRRLDPTPVTSMFGTANPAIHQERAGSTAQAAYLNKSIAVGKLDPIHLDQCRSIDEAGAQAIMQACNIFETAMILLFKDGDLIPWKWNDLFLSVHGDKPVPIDLVEPSIFKIVFRTAKPYHGYVVTSEVNQKFFNEFYRGMLPKHATVIPVMIDGRMGGMLLGFTNSKIDYRQSLRLMERLSFDLSRVFKSLRGTMSRAS